MKLVKVKQKFYDLCRENNVENELLFNEKGRPCVLILKLRYKGDLRDFIVPLRSNISDRTLEWQYFALPPNPNTKPKHKHAIHYIKMFPISKKYIDKYVVDNDEYYKRLIKIIDSNESKIISECQSYLDKCSDGKKHIMTPNLDGIIKVLDEDTE